MTKYREIPIDDSKGIKQFQEGEIVRYFGWYDPNGGRVEYTRDVKITKISDQLLYLEKSPYTAHWRACRKLEEVKPREFYVHESDLNQEREDKLEAGALWYGTWDASDLEGKFIKVREVIGEDE